MTHDTVDTSAPPAPRRMPGWLVPVLRQLSGRTGASVRVESCRALGPNVYRLALDARSSPRSVIVKGSDPVMALRHRLVVDRWLPAVGLRDLAPRLIDVVAERGGERVWQVHEDLGDRILDEGAPDRAGTLAVVQSVARLHAAFAGHPLLAECRMRGTDFGMHWYSTNVRDALRALERLQVRDLSGKASLPPSVRDRLVDALRRLRAEEGIRARAMAVFGGPETLLHGDLWPKNAVLGDSPAGPRARLVDWDRSGVGPVSYDLSTFLSRLPASERRWALARYREAMTDAGWTLPEPAELEMLFATAELARLANRVIWPAIALERGDADREWALTELASLLGWIEGLLPLLGWEDGPRAPARVAGERASVEG